MKTAQSNESVKKETVLQSLTSMHAPSQLVYNELSEIPVRDTDLFDQLEDNLLKLEDIRHRMSFMMREIRYLMKI